MTMHQRPMPQDAASHPLRGSPKIDPRALRRTLGCFPTGVAIVTTLGRDGGPVGLTISSFNSVSMDPPLVLWSLTATAGSLPEFQANPDFAVNILAADQQDLAMTFARPVENRFDGVRWVRGTGGVPVIEGAAAVLECTTTAEHPGGDHRIFIGQVLRHAATDARPMVFGNGRFCTLSDGA